MFLSTSWRCLIEIDSSFGDSHGSCIWHLIRPQAPRPGVRSTSKFSTDLILAMLSQQGSWVRCAEGGRALRVVKPGRGSDSLTDAVVRGLSCAPRPSTSMMLHLVLNSVQTGRLNKGTYNTQLCSGNAFDDMRRPFLRFALAEEDTGAHRNMDVQNIINANEWKSWDEDETETMTCRLTNSGILLSR